ncbi:hypothetical protein BpHYR1_008718 [Brachionus plicatilis]|uniref:Uncharacterized protein n=1 Tax=Brachionus plicatilis TaxID=10195 RepID=A0A3M7SR24_BRAPC|nr:hypothetical protein BpHYR1_008718 [Brachionus plicatilis]
MVIIYFEKFKHLAFLQMTDNTCPNIFRFWKKEEREQLHQCTTKISHGLIDITLLICIYSKSAQSHQQNGVIDILAKNVRCFSPDPNFFIQILKLREN